MDDSFGDRSNTVPLPSSQDCSRSISSTIACNELDADEEEDR